MATMQNKPVSFNIEKSRDQELLNFALTRGKFSTYVKGLIEADYRKVRREASIFSARSKE